MITNSVIPQASVIVYREFVHLLPLYLENYSPVQLSEYSRALLTIDCILHIVSTI